jgi:hypothetical protein
MLGPDKIYLCVGLNYTPGETDKNRCQNGETFKTCDISDDRGDGIKIIVP